MTAAKLTPAGRSTEIASEDVWMLCSTIKVSCADACKQNSSHKLTSRRPANRDDIPREQGIPRQLLPLALAVHHDGLLGILQGSELLQVAQPLCHHGALKHDKHGQCEEGVVPAEGARMSLVEDRRFCLVVQRKANLYAELSKHVQLRAADIQQPWYNCCLTCNVCMHICWLLSWRPISAASACEQLPHAQTPVQNELEAASMFTSTHPEPTSQRRTLGNRKRAPEAALPVGTETWEWGLQTCWGPIEVRPPVTCVLCHTLCFSGSEQMFPADASSIVATSEVRPLQYAVLVVVVCTHQC